MPALAALDEATRAIAGVLDIEVVLQLIVDRVRPLVGAHYAALGIIGDDGQIEQFITSGVSQQQRLAIGPPPRGHGLLGLLIREARSVRTSSIAGHVASSGFPPNHPLMTSFLGVPVESRGLIVGNFYLTDKEGAAEFTEGDESLVEMFALHAAIAIDNARLHDQVRALAVVEERDRIGRDLHDGIIQSLYGVSLSLEDLPDVARKSPDKVDEHVDRAIDSIQLAIRDIRSFIYGLRPESLGDSDLVPGLAVLTEQFRHNTLIGVELELDPTVEEALDAGQRRELLQLASEALSNSARHAQAGKLRIALGRDAGRAVLEIADDGVGFDPSTSPESGHRGLANMRARADAIGGTLAIVSRPGGGTRIVVGLPARPEEVSQ